MMERYSGFVRLNPSSDISNSLENANRFTLPPSSWAAIAAGEPDWYLPHADPIYLRQISSVVLIVMNWPSSRFGPRKKWLTNTSGWGVTVDREDR